MSDRYSEGFGKTVGLRILVETLKNTARGDGYMYICGFGLGNFFSNFCIIFSILAGAH